MVPGVCFIDNAAVAAPAPEPWAWRCLCALELGSCQGWRAQGAPMNGVCGRPTSQLLFCRFPPYPFFCVWPQVAECESFGLLGPNGAGKTTALRMMQV